MREFGRFSEKSDIYSFGVFLLELVSGREATELASSDSSQNLVEWVRGDREARLINITLYRQFICLNLLLYITREDQGSFFCLYASASKELVAV